ncbi:neural cell adhesion molecule L1.1-like isoform X3 [Alosa sapidissima]|uniref:neural cell adhesion molecule L1.1-like isoform X3 n=1 Tax=Alosa sapidissima TaxID=34773 RepID=UPI001C095E97|nr:neural cell adhesion molecule L1.1-like isoform X3 [Alosa sapidissima]
MPPAQCQQRSCRGQRSALSHQHQLLRLLFLVMATSSVQGFIDIPKGLSSPPVITKQPTSVLAFSPEDITLCCTASGTPEPSYRWVKDGALFAELEDDGTLVANKSLSLDDYQGEYRCYASNVLGTAVSDLVTVTAGYIPSLYKEQQQTFRKVEGESLVMPCDPPPDSPPHKIYWMDNDIKHIEMSDRVTPGLDGYLYFANVVPSDNRSDYTCNVRFRQHMISKEPITLKVNRNALVEERKPHIARPAKSHSSYTVLRGQSFNLECIPYGLPTPTVTWKRTRNSNQEQPLNTKNYGRWLHFEKISESDDGEYECIAQNSAGSASHTYFLTVEAAPHFTKQTQNLLYAPGETVRLECQAEGIPTPEVTWRINGVPISDVDEPRRKVTKSVLILTEAKYSDTAVYQCEAVNRHGITLINTYIHVIELAPQILTEDNKKYMMVEGKTASLECNAFGSPRPGVLWEDPRMEQAQSHSRISQTVEGTLRITDVRAADSGLYTCSVLKSNLSISAILEVLNQTEIVIPPEDQRVKSGKDAMLTCTFQVDPRLDSPDLLRWLKNGEDILESAQNDKYTIFPDGSLKITSISLDDAGSYTCEVSTPLDAEKATASITVVDKPSPPIDLKVFDRTNRSLSLSWTPGRDNNSPVTEYCIEMNEEKHGDSHTWEEVKRIEADINKLEVPLRPYGTYRFRVIAVNEIGRSHPSHASEAYTTPPAIPEHFPKHVKSASTDPDKLVITWEEMDKRDHYGPDFKYKVFWRQSVGNGPDWHHQEVSDNHFVVNNTKTFTPFEIKVRAVNQLGPGPESPPRIGHSGEDIPLEAPAGVTVDALNGKSVSVKWNPVNRESVRGHLLGYKIHVKRVTSVHGAQRRRMLEMGLRLERHVDVEEEEEEQDRILVVHGTKTEETVTGLQFYSSYELTVTAFNNKGEGPHSKATAFKTPEGAPGPPIFLEFDSPSESELTLNWRPPLKPNGILTGYRLQYGEIVDANGSTPEMQDFDIPDPKKTDITVIELNPQRSYYFYLQGRTAAGLGEATKVKGATLLDGVPPTIINVTVADTYANLSWVPGERHRNIGFQIQFLQKSAGRDWEISEQVNTHQGFYQLTNLQPGTGYHLRATLNNFTYWEGSALTSGPELSLMPNNFATQGWFIGLISASLLLLLILLILCLIKRSKGGKYSVKEKEEGQGDSEARPMKDEAFGEYRSLESDIDEKRTMSQPSLCVESKLGSDDSLAEYGDSVDIQFNEDGSFIGQYSGRREAHIVQGGHESSGATSPVNNMPPQSISFNNSVTGILDRSN